MMKVAFLCLSSAITIATKGRTVAPARISRHSFVSRKALFAFFGRTLKKDRLGTVRHLRGGDETNLTIPIFRLIR